MSQAASQPFAYRVLDVDHHALQGYRAKDFNGQEGYMLSLEIRPARFVEVGIYLHWMRTTPIDIAVDVSCMVGCTGLDRNDPDVVAANIMDIIRESHMSFML